MKYKVIIFDFDDTLVESHVQKWAQHQHVAKKFYDIDLSEEEIRAHWGKPIDKLIEILYKNSDTLENMHANLISTRSDFLKKPYEGIVDIITVLLDEGREVGILSATNTGYLLDDLALFKFPAERFFVIQGADQTTVHKPDPLVFEPLLEKLAAKGIQKNEMVYVGDSLDDFQAAIGAGIDFIAVATGLYTKEHFQQAGAVTIIPNIRELKALI